MESKRSASLKKWLLRVKEEQELVEVGAVMFIIGLILGVVLGRSKD